MMVWGRTIAAVALAAWASAGCTGGAYMGFDAGGGGAGNAASSGVSSPVVAGTTSGTPSGSGVSTLMTAGSPFESGSTFPAGSPFGSGFSTPSGSPFGSGVATGSFMGTGVASGSFVGGSGTVMTTGTSGSVTDIPPPPPQDVDAQAFCKVPNVDAGSLPFVVDTAFVPSGWMGDAPAYAAVPAYPATGSPAYPATTARMTLLPTGYSHTGDACTPDGVGRSNPTAKGVCWKVTFVPFPKTIQPGGGPGAMKIGGGPGYGWAGAFWQYPRNNWGTVGGGYPIPPGATTVSFWARGHDGGEKVRFFTGEGLNIPCSDYVSTANTNAAFPIIPAWTHYTIDITGLDYGATNITPGQGQGGYFGGVTGAFGFGVGDQTLPSLNGASAPPNATDPTNAPVADPAVPGDVFPPFFDSTIQFYIDDIEFQ
jgi:hypothetical protein